MHRLTVVDLHHLFGLAPRLLLTPFAVVGMETQVRSIAHLIRLILMVTVACVSDDFGVTAVDFVDTIPRFVLLCRVSESHTLK